MRQTITKEPKIKTISSLYLCCENYVKCETIQVKSNHNDSLFSSLWEIRLEIKLGEIYSEI